MKSIVILLLLSTVSGTKLRDVLKSNKDTLKLYQHFKEAKDVHFLPAEERFRFGLFRKSAEQVATLNEDESEEATYELNEFSVMTREERAGYLGFNGTQAEEEAEQEEYVVPARVKRSVIPESVNWVDNGYVTPVQDQSRCGSCWAFGAIGTFEGEYKKATGILRKFSEQELLDCTYEDLKPRDITYKGVVYKEYYYNGCGGGWYYTSFELIRRSGRLASTVDYIYHESDCKCESDVKRNSMIAAKVNGHVRVARDETAVIEALAEHVMAVAFVVTDNFYPYKRGVWKDTGCLDVGSANHAVTMVGYTPTYVLAKNSWGTGWGDSGYIRFKRNHNHCHLWRYASYPTMVQTDEVDYLHVDEPSDYDATLTDPHPHCEMYDDTRNDCDLEECAAQQDGSDYWTECNRTCNNCGHRGAYTGECPAGTVRCSDQVCKHVHMC